MGGVDVIQEHLVLSRLSVPMDRNKVDLAVLAVLQERLEPLQTLSFHVAARYGRRAKLDLVAITEREQVAEVLGRGGWLDVGILAIVGWPVRLVESRAHC